MAIDAKRAPGLDAEWRELADRVGAPPFMYPEWFSAWFAAFGGRPLPLTLRRGRELTGVLPLTAAPGLLRSATNWHTPLYGAVLDRPERGRELARVLLARRPRRIDLAMLDAEDPLFGELLAGAAASRRPTIQRVVARQPYVDLSCGVEDFESSLPRKLRKELARLERRLGERGELRLDVHDGTEQLEALLERGFAIEGSGWKRERGTAIASQPQTRRFYTEVARWAAARGWLALAFLVLDDRPIAFDLCLQSGGSIYVLKGGFDIEFRSFGPGMLLTWQSLRRAFACGFSSYEFLGSEQSYKLIWTQSLRTRWRCQVFGRSPAGLLELAAWRYGRPAVQRLRLIRATRYAARSRG